MNLNPRTTTSKAVRIRVEHSTHRIRAERDAENGSACIMLYGLALIGVPPRILTTDLQNVIDVLVQMRIELEIEANLEKKESEPRPYLSKGDWISPGLRGLYECDVAGRVTRDYQDPIPQKPIEKPGLAATTVVKPTAKTQEALELERTKAPAFTGHHATSFGDY